MFIFYFNIILCVCVLLFVCAQFIFVQIKNKREKKKHHFGYQKISNFNFTSKLIRFYFQYIFKTSLNKHIEKNFIFKKFFFNLKLPTFFMSIFFLNIILLKKLNNDKKERE